MPTIFSYSRDNNANRSVGREKLLWIDINEALNFDGGTRFVHDVASRMSFGALPASVVIEGMLPKADVVRLPELQRLPTMDAVR